MTEYVIKSKDSLLEEYILLVADRLGFRFENITWDFSSTDTKEDATKFEYKGIAHSYMTKLNLHEDDWEVVEVEG